MFPACRPLEAEAGPAGLDAYTREHKNQARQEVCDRLVSVIYEMRSVLMEVRENGGGGPLTTDLAARANMALSAVTAGTSAFGDMLRLEQPFDIPLKPAGVMNPLAKTARESGKRKPRASDDNNGPKRSGSKAGAAAASGGANASALQATGSGGTASLDTETSRKRKALKTTAKAAVKGSKLSSRASSVTSADNNSDDAVLASRDADGDTGTPSTLVSGGVQQKEQEQVRSGRAEDPIALSSNDEDAESNGARGSAESGAMEENGTAPVPARACPSGVLVDHNSAQQQGLQGTGTAGVRTGTPDNPLGAQAPSKLALATHGGGSGGGGAFSSPPLPADRRVGTSGRNLTPPSSAVKRKAADLAMSFGTIVSTGGRGDIGSSRSGGSRSGADSDASPLG
ncbi:unnamed protein product [Ectocarpus sp. CCAP 1310/34]|nr:unnamed protein product [Ectocarpus sp. CCAP 1310/34]